MALTTGTAIRALKKGPAVWESPAAGGTLHRPNSKGDHRNRHDWGPGEEIGTLFGDAFVSTDGLTYWEVSVQEWTWSGGLFGTIYDRFVPAYLLVSDEGNSWCNADEYESLLARKGIADIGAEVRTKLSDQPAIAQPTITYKPTKVYETVDDYLLTFANGWQVRWSDWKDAPLADWLPKYNNAGKIPGQGLTPEEEQKKAEEDAKKQQKSLLTTTNILLAMLASGLLGTLLYLALKNRRNRRKPY